MISGEMIQMLVIGGVVGSTLEAVVIGFPLLKKKGINNIDAKLTTIEKALNAVEPAIGIGKEIAPNNKIINIADFIEKWAKIGVQKAEQLYHTSQLTNNEDRKKAAIDTVYSALSELNIEPTENQKRLIEDTIEAAVNGLGHKELTESERQAQLQKLQTKLVQVMAERDSLEDAITTVASTVQATQKF